MTRRVSQPRARSARGPKGPEGNQGDGEAFEERGWQGRRGTGVAVLRQVPRTQPGDAHSDASTSNVFLTGPKIGLLEVRGAATVCPRCGTDNVPGAKFCTECGSSLATSCPECGHITEPGQNFCAECGTALSPRSASTPVTARGATEAMSAPATPRRDTAELRTVSVLFVDLVGYTSLSELLDPEDVRDLLGHYFDAARRIVDRYGGTIEKFIGDAVMAVW